MENASHEDVEGGNAPDESKTLHERRRKASPLAIQVQNKRQKIGDAVRAEEETQPHNEIREQSAAEANEQQQELLIPDSGWMARWANIPFKRFMLNPWIIYSTPITCNAFDHMPPVLAGLPHDILMRIFEHLDPPWQVCLALSCKIMGHVSYHINQGNGLLYTRGERLRLLWRLEPSMGRHLKMCACCEKFRPINPSYWKERRKHGLARTTSMIYGRDREDFMFCNDDCPECTAEKLWSRTQVAHNELQRVLW